MTRSPKNSSDGSTSSTSRSTTERSAGPTTQTTTSRSDRWHATYNAALTGLLAYNGTGVTDAFGFTTEWYAEVHQDAARFANFMHGKRRLPRGKP